MAAWMEPGALEPLSPVMRWPGCENRFRRFVVEGEPVVLGALAVGDSICVTNPTYSRGMSLATRQAFALADIVASEGLRDLHGLALRADDLAERTLRPWFSDSVAQDGLRKALRRGESGPRALQDAVTLQQIAAASRHDDLVWHALARRSGMLDEPDAIFARPEVQARVRAVIEARPPAAAAGPSRTELLRLIDELAGPPLQAPPIS
jgi:hypothetical protein